MCLQACSVRQKPHYNCVKTIHVSTMVPAEFLRVEAAMSAPVFQVLCQQIIRKFIFIIAYNRLTYIGQNYSNFCIVCCNESFLLYCKEITNHIFHLF